MPCASSASRFPASKARWPTISPWWPRRWARARSTYLTARLRAAAALVVPEADLVERMQTALAGRPMRDYTAIERPAELPAELVFPEGETRRHAQGHRGVVCLGDEEHRLLLCGRRAT